MRKLYGVFLFLGFFFMSFPLIGMEQKDSLDIISGNKLSKNYEESNEQTPLISPNLGTSHNSDEELNEQTPLISPNLGTSYNSDEESNEQTITILGYKESLYNTTKFCTPYMLAKIILAASGMWRSYLYSQLDSAALQSEMVALTYEFLLVGVGMAGLTSTTILTGYLNRDFNQQGERSNLQVITIGNVHKTSSLVTLGYSLLTIPMFLQAKNIIQSIGLVTNPEINEQIQEFCNGFAWGIIPTLMLYNDEQFLLGLGHSKVPLIFDTMYAGLSSLLAYPLALGEWGAPQLGVRGIGIGISGGALVSWLALRGWLLKSEYKDFNLYDFRTLKKDSFKKYLEYFLPFSLTNFVNLVSGFITSQFITSFSKDVATAYSASSTYFQNLRIVLQGYTGPITSLIANADPRKYLHSTESNYNVALENINLYIGSSIFSSLGMALLFTVPAAIWPDKFIDFFGGNQVDSIVDLARTYLWFNVEYTLLQSVFRAERATLYGLQDTIIPFIIDTSIGALNILGASMVAIYTNAPQMLIAATIIGPFEGVIVYSSRLFVFMKNVSKKFCDQVVQEDGFLMKSWKKFTSFFNNQTIEEAF